ncbi:hypothetical protein MUU48_16155 [Scandinavium sp. H11S7]|uniref:hypothetical protein n=1 Tax=Scandinavium hiltneri TaxID=2926519 RepID=UPI002165CD2D|nr:hypothetical protein [Scandinavium hiltneri]MCS2158425.1 hypothetical protein [Scandinavium hiltneri]
MSKISLAAQRSTTTGEAVYFTRQCPDLRLWLLKSLSGLMYIAMLVIAGSYAHLYWQCLHPAPPAQVKKLAHTEVTLSDMHYVFVTKTFPPPVPKPVQQTATPVSENTLSHHLEDDDWTHTPDGELATQPLPTNSGNRPPPPKESELSLEQRLLQAVKEQQQDYSQGKIPDVTPPDDLSFVQPTSENDDSAHITAAVIGSQNNRERFRTPPVMISDQRRSKG